MITVQHEIKIPGLQMLFQLSASRPITPVRHMRAFEEKIIDNVLAERGTFLRPCVYMFYRLCRKPTQVASLACAKCINDKILQVWNLPIFC